MKKRMQKTTTRPGALHCFKCASCSKMQWLKKLLASCFFSPYFFCKTTAKLCFSKPGANSSWIQLFFKKGSSDMQNLWTRCLVSVSFFLLFFFPGCCSHAARVNVFPLKWFEWFWCFCFCFFCWVYFVSLRAFHSVLLRAFTPTACFCSHPNWHRQNVKWPTSDLRAAACSLVKTLAEKNKCMKCCENFKLFFFFRDLVWGKKMKLHKVLFCSRMDEAEVDKSSGIIMKRWFQEILSSCHCSYCLVSKTRNINNVIAVLTLQMRGTEGNTVCTYSLCLAWNEDGSHSCHQCAKTKVGCDAAASPSP